MYRLQNPFGNPRKAVGLSSLTPHRPIGGGLNPPSTRSDFRPAWWCRNPHLQTLWSSLGRQLPRPRYRREVLDLPDGDFIDLDWLNRGTGRPTAVLIHGLCGSSRSSYIRGLAATLAASGWSVVAMNMRGAGGRPNRRPRTYHSGHTEDLDFLLGELARRHPRVPVCAAGFSLGGNLLLKWLGEHPGTPLLHAAVAVSVPMVLEESARRMNSGLSRLYQRRLVTSLQRSVVERLHLFRGRGNIPVALEASGFREFDEHLTAPLNGFEGANDYYTRCSSRGFLHRITVPTLIVQALDDPFMTTAVVPGADELSDRVCLELHSHGGHVGFVGGALPGRTRYWLDGRIYDFFRFARSHESFD